VYGAVRNSNFIVQLDDLPGDRHSAPANANAGILTELVGLSPGKHVVRITLEDGNGQLDFGRVMFDAGVRRFVVWLHSFVIHIRFVDETSDWSKTPTEMRMNSPGWSFVSWFLLEHFYHNVDGSNTDRSQKGVFSQITGARAEFTFFGMSYGPEPAYRDAVNLIALCPATTHRCRQPRKCNLSHW